MRLTRAHLVGFLSLTAFCLAIALLLFGLGVTSPFGHTLVISLSIGWCISGCSALLAPFLDRYVSAFLTALVLTPIGLIVGLSVAGFINHGTVLAYLTSDDAALVLGVFFAIIGYLIFEARSRLMTARADLEKASAVQDQQEKALLSAELKLLQAQIEPHFLFNTLSNVIGLIQSNPPAAEETLVRLTTLLRASLDRTRQETTTLREELAVVEAYLGIHAVRMPHRLSYVFKPDLAELPDRLLDTRLPPLLIQPLVENAIQHGIDPLEEGGEITIEVNSKDQALVIEVLDTGRGIKATSGRGTGLNNVRERLSALYGEKAKFRLEENQPRGVRASLVISVDQI